MKKYFLLFIVVFVVSNVFAQNDTIWHHKKCAVVLTYDDALNVHLDNAIPVLDSLGLKATFYLSAYFPGCRERLSDWKKAAADCYAVNGESGEQLIHLVKQALANNSLLVFLFHGVGGEHSLNVSLPAHSALLHFLKQNESEIWIAPMIEVAEYIKNYQSRKK